MATTTATQAASPPQRSTAAGGAPPRRPYTVREAAALLGVSADVIEGNYRDLEGFRIGRRILIPRRVVDRVTGTPGDAPDADRAPGGAESPAAGPPALERVLALLPLLAPDERVAVAQAALSPTPPA